MTKRDMQAINNHEDAALFRETLNYTAATTEFPARLVEKDYFCTVLLAFLASETDNLIFKGGTCLAKVHAGFYRLSEDLDFAISVPVDAPRARRSALAVPLKTVWLALPKRLTCFRVGEPLRGANNSTQYVGTADYISVLTGQNETIKCEVALREPILQPAHMEDAAIILLDPLTGKAAVPVLQVKCISSVEAFAEKVRAALTRREPAVRDYCDLDYAVRMSLLAPNDDEFMQVVRRKLAMPGNDPVNVSGERLAQLRRQVEANLRPVLRERDYRAFDLERAFTIAQEIARSI
jgi:predicted nucleotidyltransferase component of viral defense system